MFIPSWVAGLRGGQKCEQQLGCVLIVGEPALVSFFERLKVDREPSVAVAGRGGDDKVDGGRYWFILLVFFLVLEEVEEQQVVAVVTLPPEAGRHFRRPKW